MQEKMPGRQRKVVSSGLALEMEAVGNAHAELIYIEDDENGPTP